MSKYVLLMSIVLFLTFISVISLSINLEVSSDVLSAEISKDVPGLTGILRFLVIYLELFWNIIAFRVPGLPFAFTLFVFWPLSSTVIFMIISIIRGLP
jgi:hypothetical protein